MNHRKNFLKISIRFIAVFVFSFCLLFFFKTASAGVPKIISFQGRLTNAAGDLLGGSGTNYYFKFEIHSTATGDNELWSSGGTAITIKVTQGVFNTLLGDTSAGYGAIGLDFDNANYYLEVQVDDDSGFASPETLSPRQRIAASGFAINAETVHGGRFLNASGVGQFGGLATESYSRFGTAATDHGLAVSSDLLVSGILELNSQVFFDTNASVAGNFELTGAGSKFGINAGSQINTTLEVGGTASISGSLTLGSFLFVAGNTSVSLNFE